MRQLIYSILFVAAIFVPSNIEAQQGRAAEPVIEVRPHYNDKRNVAGYIIYEAGATNPFRGTLKDYHPNGKVKTEFGIAEGKPSSLTVYYDNGRLDEEAFYLKMSYNGPFWGTKQPSKYNYPNGDTRALYGSSSDIAAKPFSKDHVYKNNFNQKFRTKEQIDTEELPPFFFARLEERARNGHEGTQIFLGYLYGSGYYVPKDINKSLEFMIMDAERGNPRSQYFVANSYFAIDETTQKQLDPDNGLYWR